MLDNKIIIDINNLTYINNQGRTVFDNCSFKLMSGQIALIKGFTGTGKTSLVELIVGKKFPASGTIIVSGHQVSKKRSALKKIRQHIGGVGGIFEPVSYRSVYENMRYPLILRGVSNKDQKVRILNCLTQFKLLSKKNEKVSYLSRGEKNLLMLARAIVADQPILLIDEPLTGLDQKMIPQINQFLNNLAIMGHSMIILTSGRTELDIRSAVNYEIKDGQIV